MHTNRIKRNTHAFAKQSHPPKNFKPLSTHLTRKIKKQDFFSCQKRMGRQKPTSAEKEGEKKERSFLVHLSSFDYSDSDVVESAIDILCTVFDLNRARASMLQSMVRRKSVLPVVPKLFFKSLQRCSSGVMIYNNQVVVVVSLPFHTSQISIPPNLPFRPLPPGLQPD